MTIQVLSQAFTVCQLTTLPEQVCTPFHFFSITDEEISLVCPTCDVPPGTLQHEDGWRAFRIAGVLDFSLIGILARISSLLADQSISIYALSTYNTDYVLTKDTQFNHAISTLQSAGYTIEML